MMTPAYASVVLDVDSTISGIEGIDWLAQRRGDIVARKVASLTDAAMRGEIPLEEVYGARLGAIRPRRDDVDALSRAYVNEIAPDAVETIRRLRRAGVHIVMVSGGLRHALVRLAFHLGVDLSDLHAVDIHFDAVGAFTGFDQSSPLTTSEGKRAVVESLALPRPILAVGDGATDVAMRDVTDRFAAFTGFVTRPGVVAKADLVLDSFASLASHVLS
jgi:phosphoserine phosphatase